jgi:mRNA-degrading endonuclease RelE of RelBE toxin-antitoxin system
MAYEVELTDTTKKRLARFDRRAQEAFFKKIDRIKEDPEFFLKPLRYDLKGRWEYYFKKSFRIIFSIYKEEKKLVVEAIKHRDEFD